MREAFTKYACCAKWENDTSSLKDLQNMHVVQKCERYYELERFIKYAMSI